MPFGLFYALVSFQGYINKILAEKLNIFVIIYMNDILIYKKDAEQAYVDAVCWVLKILQKYDFFVNLKKCHFYKNEVRFLGYVILAQYVQIENKRIETIKN